MSKNKGYLSMLDYYQFINIISLNILCFIGMICCMFIFFNVKLKSVQIVNSIKEIELEIFKLESVLRSSESLFESKTSSSNIKKIRYYQDNLIHLTPCIYR